MTLAIAPFRPSLGNAAKRVRLETAGPWKDWHGSRHARAIRFMETYCRPAKGQGHGQPIRLAKFQKDFLEEVLATDVSTSILTTPRGNGKSTFGGALAVWAAFDDDETGAPQVPIVATTISQAVRSCYGVAASMIKTEPELANRSIIYTGIAAPRVVVHFNGGELFPISNDTDGLQGLDPSLAIVDEIGFQPMESWTALRMASGKRERSLVVGMGTPGLDRDNALWRLRVAIKEGARIPGFVFREYSAPENCDIFDRAAWRQANPALRSGFLRIAALATDAASVMAGREGGVPESHFRLFRLNQWVDGTDSWLGRDGRKLWDEAHKPWQFVAGARTWVGVDVGLKRDSTAVVAAQQRPDGRIHVQSRVWIPSRDVAVDVTDVMQHIRDLAKQYDLRAVSYDPRFFDVPAKMLSDERIKMLEIPQSPERMTPICGALLELVKRGSITHDGDPVLATHVLNGVARFSERGFTLQKAKSRGRIDALIALALAVERAQFDLTKPASRPRQLPKGFS